MRTHTMTVTAREIAKATDISQAQAYHAAKRLAAAGELVCKMSDCDNYRGQPISVFTAVLQSDPSLTLVRRALQSRPALAVVWHW